jgi:hypothetical protein
MNPASGMWCDSVALVTTFVQDFCELQYSPTNRKQHMTDDFTVMREPTTESNT